MATKPNTAIPAADAAADNKNAVGLTPVPADEALLNAGSRILALEKQIEAKDKIIDELKAANEQQEELIAELQEQIDAQDNSGLDVPAFPTVKHNGITYQVHARKFKIKGDPKSYTLADLKDVELVAKLVEQGAGFLIAQK